MNTCKQCNIDYESKYTNTEGYEYIIETTKFCSKSCATKYQQGSITKEMVENEIILFITSKNRYCTKEEIQKGIKRSSKTFTKFNISIKNIQEVLGFTKSKSHFQECIYTHLKTHFNNIECEKTFNSLLSPKGFALRLDFYIKELNLIVEADGTQHTDKNNPWYNSYYAICDLLKNEYAKKHNINIVRIPYTKNVTDNYIKQYLSQFI